MDEEQKPTLQQRITSLGVFWFNELHVNTDLPSDFRPWTCELSPSALYSCSLKCRKLSGIKTPEVKWVSIKRWVTQTPNGIDLPPGVFFSVKRREEFIPTSSPPHFQKTEYVLIMLPFGNVWSQISPGVPITENWLFSDYENMLILERLMRKDAAHPIAGYFNSVHKYMIENTDQIGIHLKRKKKSP
jgi:hypothetical protein